MGSEAIMIVAALLLAVTSALLVAPELRHFPGSYFDTAARARLQSRVMQSWPGPEGLLEIWRTEDLRTERRVAILVGAAIHHDPTLLPIYRESILSPSSRIRQAAAYGYHDLIGGLTPDVRGGVDQASSDQLRREIDLFSQTLTRNTLVELWLQALLKSEGRSLPGFWGVAPTVPASECLRAIDAVMTIDDLDRIAEAYEISQNRTSRIGLMRLIEGLTLSRFVPRPSGQQKGWGPEIYDRALADLDAALAGWPRNGCTIDVDRVLIANLATMGAPVADPRAPEACPVWTSVLRIGDPGWWSMAARRLYMCGGPWQEIPVLKSSGADARSRRDAVLSWYGISPTGPVTLNPIPGS